MCFLYKFESRDFVQFECFDFLQFWNLSSSDFLEILRFDYGSLLHVVLLKYAYQINVTKNRIEKASWVVRLAKTITV